MSGHVCGLLDHCRRNHTRDILGVNVCNARHAAVVSPNLLIVQNTCIVQEAIDTLRDKYSTGNLLESHMSCKHSRTVMKTYENTCCLSRTFRWLKHPQRSE